MFNIRKITNINKRATYYNFKINPIGREMCHGITVSGDGRYLLSDFTISQCSL